MDAWGFYLVTEAPGSARRFVQLQGKANVCTAVKPIAAGHTQQQWCLHMSSRFHELGKVPGHMPQAPCQAHESNLTYVSTNRYCTRTYKNVRQD